MKFIYQLIFILIPLMGFAQPNYHWHHLNQGNSLGNPQIGILNGIVIDSSSNKLITYGAFDNNSTICHIAEWDGQQSWSQYGTYIQFDSFTSEIFTALFHHDTLFLGVHSGSDNCPVSRPEPGLIYFNGSQICNVNGGFCRTTAGGNFVYSLLNFEDTLYAAGNFRGANCMNFIGDTTNLIAKYNGNEFVSIGTGINNGVSGVFTAGRIHKLYEANSNIILVGVFDFVGSQQQSNIAVTDGENWLPITEFPWVILDVIQWNNDLYILSDALYKLVGNTWIQVAQFSNGANPGFVESMEIFNGELVVGGGFTSVNGFPANSIAKYDGVTWDNMDGGTISAFKQVKDLLSWNGSLYACGRFDQMGTVQANKIARWGLTTSITEAEKLVVLKVLTNPCHEQIKISLGPTSTPLAFELLDVSGRFILKGNFNSGTNEINIDGLSAGVYIIHQKQKKFKPVRVLVY